MPNDQNKGGQSGDLPPYERILREQAAARDAEHTAKAQQTAAAAQRSSEKKGDGHPATLAEAAARRSEARQKAAAAAKARQMAQEAEREAQLAEEAARKAEEAAGGPRNEAEAAAAFSHPQEHAKQASAAHATHSAKTTHAAKHDKTSSTRRSHAKKESQPAASTPKRGSQAPTRHKRKRHFPWLAIVMLLCIAVVVAAVGFLGRNMMVPANANDTKITEVEIPDGMVVSQMGDKLQQEGVIRSADAFKLYVRLTGTAGNLQAGVHKLSPSMTMGEIVNALQEGAGETGLNKLTINEGLTVDQIAELIGKDTSFSADDFLALMKDDAFLSGLVQKYPILTDSYNNPNVRYVLEGYLFPATYEFKPEDGLEALVTQMVDKTNEVLSSHQAEIDASGRSVQDIMSLASIVEKEGKTSKDRKLIAGVFNNRLESGMPIQSDITVLYALGTHKEMVTYDDLQVDSPYNLYANTGLPPGPVNSPSEDSIEAVLEPTDSDYLYFYANIKTGEVFYTNDYEQHQKWQQEYEETGDIQG